MLRRDNIFHPRDRKKQYSKKKGKKKESNHLVTRTGLAPLRNFVIPFRFDHDHGEKKRIPCYIPSMKFTDRRDPIDPSFVHFFSIFYLILPLPRPLLFLFLSPFFSKPIQSGWKKGKDRIRGYLTIEREWEMKREREKRFYYSIIYFTRFIAAAADFASLYSTPAAASYQFAIPTIFALKNRDRARFCHQQFAHRTFKLILLSTCSPRLPCISPLLFFLFFFFFRTESLLSLSFFIVFPKLNTFVNARNLYARI